MSQRPPLSRVVRIRCHRQICCAGDRFYGSNVNRILVHVLQSDAVAIDVIPCFCGVEGQLVGHDADHGAVLVVVDFVVEGYAASQERDDGGNGRDAP